MRGKKSTLAWIILQKMGLKEALVRQVFRLGLKLASESECTGVGVQRHRKTPPPPYHVVR